MEMLEVLIGCGIGGVITFLFGAFFHKAKAEYDEAMKAEEDRDDT